MAPAWGGYQNGRIPQKTPPLVQLVPGNPDSWAHPVFASQFQKMDDACFKATGYRIGLVEVYRELGVEPDRKVTVASKTSTGSSNQWFQKGRMDRGLTVAATPGYSNHGWALAVDIAHYYIPEVWAWLQRNASRYGFSWATGKASGEKWHWEYVGSLSVKLSDKIKALISKITPTKEADTMGYRYMRTNGNPAEFADTNGVVVREHLTADQVGLTKAGTTVKPIEKGATEKAAVWEARKAAILTDWRREAAQNVAALGGTVAAPGQAAIQAAVQAALTAAGLTPATIATAVLDEDHRRTAS